MVAVFVPSAASEVAVGRVRPKVAVLAVPVVRCGSVVATTAGFALVVVIMMLVEDEVVKLLVYALVMRGDAQRT